MIGPEIQEKAIEVIITMNSAIINLRLYPPTNALIMKTIDRLQDALGLILNESDALLFAESEKNLLIAGEPLSQKNRQRPQVAVFLMLMINWGIKSIAFKKGLGKDELSLLLEAMGKKPEDVRKGQGLERLIREGKMPHIQINQKIYIETAVDQELATSLEAKDKDVIEYITAEGAQTTLDPEKVRAMAKDPQWFSRIFQAGMQRLTDRDTAPSTINLSESMLQMLRTLDKISGDTDKKAISRLVAGSVLDMDTDFISALLTRNMEGLLDNHLFDQIVNRMNDEQFEQVAGQIRKWINHASTKEKAGGEPALQSIETAYRHIMSSDKGMALQQQIQERKVREEEERQQKTAHLRETGRYLLRKLEEEPLPDESTLKFLPEVAGALRAEGEAETAEAILEQLIGRLFSDQPDARAGASEPLAEILENLPPEQRTSALTKHLDKLLKWLKTETVPTDAFKIICLQMGSLAQGMLRDRRFSESIALLATFNFMISRQKEKEDPLRSAANETLRKVASADILDICLEELRFNRSGQRNDAGRTLILMAEYSINPLLDILRESQDRSERILILNLIPEMGPRVAPAVFERIDESEPWYYLRNMVRLMGRVGSEAHIKILVSILTHEDPRVQTESLKSINLIGGASRGSILLNALSECSDSLKASIVTSLGSMRNRDAVKPLMELFKSRVSLSEELKADLQEKICLALGSIGEKDALPFLTEVSRQVGVFGIGAHHPKVRAAAGRAMGMIKIKTS